MGALNGAPPGSYNPVTENFVNDLARQHFLKHPYETLIRGTVSVKGWKASFMFL